MKSGNQQTFLNLSPKSIILLFFSFVIALIITFKNFLFQPTFLLKNFGQLSVELSEVAEVEEHSGLSAQNSSSQFGSMFMAMMIITVQKIAKATAPNISIRFTTDI